MPKKDNDDQLALFKEAKSDLQLKAPYARGSDTSKEAAESIEPSSGTLRAHVLGFIKRRGKRGMTCDELEHASGLTHQTASARINELMKLQAIRDSGKRRRTRSGRNAVVWVQSSVEVADGKADQHSSH